MFVSDRSFFMRDPARSLYSTAAYYLSIMTVNAAVTIINAAFLVLLMYGMIGEFTLCVLPQHSESGLQTECMVAALGPVVDAARLPRVCPVTHKLPPLVNILAEFLPHLSP